MMLFSFLRWFFTTFGVVSFALTTYTLVEDAEVTIHGDRFGVPAVAWLFFGCVALAVLLADQEGRVRRRRVAARKG